MNNLFYNTYMNKNQTIALQVYLNLHRTPLLIVDGIRGKLTEKSLEDFISGICIAHGVEPELVLAVGIAESGLDPFLSHINADAKFNPTGQNTTDRGMMMINSYWHSEVPDEVAF